MSDAPKVVAIIQARMGSTRFPGKMMAEIGGQPIIRWVISRVSHAVSLDAIVLATTTSDRDAPLVAVADELGVPAWRGSEEDVMARFMGAADHVGAGVIVRVCADNPVVDPDAIDAAVGAFKDGDADYVYNHVPKRDCEYPDGLGVEIFSLETLKSIAERTEDPAHREHVTSFIWDHTDRFRIAAAPCPRRLRADADPIRLDVDTPQDYRRMKDLLVGAGPEISGQEILTRWRKKFGAAQPA